MLLSVIALFTSGITTTANAFDGVVFSTVEINDSTANWPVLSDSDTFGFSVANIGDLDGDGVADLAVGARDDDDSGNNRGAVHIMFMETQILHISCGEWTTLNESTNECEPDVTQAQLDVLQDIIDFLLANFAPFTEKECEDIRNTAEDKIEDGKNISKKLEKDLELCDELYP